jgi:hypothetical protein
MNLYRAASLTEDWRELGAIYVRASDDDEATAYAVAHYNNPRVTEAGIWLELLEGGE